MKLSILSSAILLLFLCSNIFASDEYNLYWKTDTDRGGTDNVLMQLAAVKPSAQSADPYLREEYPAAGPREYEKTDNAGSREIVLAQATTRKSRRSRVKNPASPNESFDVIIVGTGNSIGYSLPIDIDGEDYGYSQQIYLQTDIDAGGTFTIEEIYFEWNGGPIFTKDADIAVYMAHTSKTSFSSTSDWVTSGGGWTQVWSGTYSMPTSSGWVEIDITDFEYDNSDNLLIAVDYNEGNDPGMSGDDHYCTNQGSNRSIQQQSSSNIDPSSPGTGTRSSYCPNVKLSGTVVSTDANSTVTAGVGSEPATISSLVDTDGERVQVFDVIFTDAGTSDGVATIIDQIQFTQGSANDVADWTDAIAGAKLYGPDLDGSPGAELAGTVNATTITFTSDDMISVADGGNETYQLRIYLKNGVYGATATDKDNLEFRLAYLNITTDGTGSSFGSGSIESGDANVAIDIDATALAYEASKPPSSVNIDANFNVTVNAVDANGNVDIDETSSITLSRNNGTGTLSSTTGLIQSLSSGTYAWTDVQYDTEETFKIEAGTGSLTNAVTGNISCSSISFPQVADITETAVSSATSNPSFNLPATVDPGDLLLLFVGIADVSISSTPTGWTELWLLNGDGSNGAGAVYAKDAVGTEDGGSVTVPAASSTAAGQVYRITAGTWGSNLAADVDIQGNTSGTSSANPNPPSVTADWGSADNLFIALFAARDDDATVSSYPTNYSNGDYIISGGGGNNGATVGSARREYTSASDDPGTFTLSESENWRSATVVISPFEDYPDDWTYSSDLYINTTSSGADVSGDVLNFPLLVRLTSTNFTFSEAETNGEDIRFAKSNGDHLGYEIERWVEGSSLADIWVLVDTVYGDNSTQYVTMYWGNSSVGDRSMGDAVFRTDTDFDFVGVWHIHDDFDDATSNANTGIDDGTEDVSANIANGQRFDIGTTDDIDVAGSASFNAMQYLTGSCWAKVDDRDVDYQTLISFYQSSSDRAYLFLDDNTNGIIVYNNIDGSAGEEAVTSYLPLDDTWFHAAWVINENDKWSIYINGDSTAGSTDTRDLSGLNDGFLTRFGDRASEGGRPWGGDMDEIRISKVARSSDWIKLCYKTQVSGSNVIIQEDISLLPLTVTHTLAGGRGTSDEIKIETDNWKIIFDEDIGGGIKWLSYEKSGGKTNELDPTRNLFFIRTHDIYSYSVSGDLTLLDSCKLFASIRQDVSINSHPWQIDYTVYGSGRMFIKAETDAYSGLYDPDNGLGFGVETDVSNSEYSAEDDDNANLSNYILHSDKGSGKFDVMLALFEDWTQASGFMAETSDSFGYVDSDWQLAAGEKQVWEFMLDFGHRKWNDTAGVGKHCNDYRGNDSLEFRQGTYRMEQAWEHGLVGHWTFDEGTGTTASDYAGVTNTHDGTITGGAWADGKWNGGFDCEMTGGADYLTVSSNAADFNTPVFTIMMWIKPEDAAISTSSELFSKYTASTGVKLTGDASGYLALTLDGTTVSGNSAPGTGSWKHVVATYNYHSENLRLYIDGKLDKRSVQQYPITSNAANVVIGSGFDGIIDDVRYYNTEISEETIRAIYNNGFRSNEGMYMLRASNNNTIHFTIDGSATTPHYFPILQIDNYWATSKPTAVYYNGSWLTENTHYYAKLKDDENLLYLGFDKIVTSSDLQIYIDDTDQTGAFTTDPMPKMTYGADGDHYYVKNLSGTTFGAAGSDEFYLYWKMTLSGDNDGELDQFKSSEISASTAISSATNLISSDGAYGSLGSSQHWAGTGDAKLFSSDNVTAPDPPTWEVLESSETRVRLRVDDRTVSGSGKSYKIGTEWTIYPTGQIFRWDSVAALSEDNTHAKAYFMQIYGSATATYHEDETDKYAGYHTCTGIHDFAVGFLSGFEDGAYSDTILVDGSGDIAPLFDAGGWRGIYFEKDNAYGWPDEDEPYITNFYLDIRKDPMNEAYIDSVCRGVQEIVSTDITFAHSGSKGSLVTDSDGDYDTDGFNEREGAFFIEADNNSVNFKLEADAVADGCRFSPAFHITNYTASTKPGYVNFFNASDTMRLTEGYGFNSYVNATDNYVVVQLDTVFCVDAYIYIASDVDLAVEMSDFYATPGDGNDTLFWRTESEKDNFGFFLYRRIKPEFLDSLTQAVDSVKKDSELDEVGQMLRQKKIGYPDTTWVSITKKIIPSAVGGNSPEPHDYSKVDWDVENNIEYEYRLEAVSIDKTRETFGPISVRPIPILPKRFYLFHNYPNPVRHYTNIRFDLPKKSKVSLFVYNLQGRLIARVIKPDRKMKPGFYNIRWRCKDDYGRLVASGPYIYRLKAGKKYVKSRLMIVVK